MLYEWRKSCVSVVWEPNIYISYLKLLNYYLFPASTRIHIQQFTDYSVLLSWIPLIILLLSLSLHWLLDLSKTHLSLWNTYMCVHVYVHTYLSTSSNSGYIVYILNSPVHIHVFMTLFVHTIYVYVGINVIHTVLVWILVCFYFNFI